MRKKGRTAMYFVTVSLFVIVISLPMLNEMFCLIPVDEPFGQWENRNPSSEPLIEINDLDTFPPQYENYFNDKFQFRQLCLNSYIFIKYKILNQSPYPSKVIIGEKGWLYEGGTERKLYEGKIKIQKDTLEIILKELHCRAEKLKAQNIKFYVAIAPTKYRIYPEFLPDYIVKQSDYTSELISRIKSDSLITFIDIESELLENKKSGILFHQTDNHWNSLGGYYASATILKTMSKDMPAIVPYDISSYKIDTVINSYGNLSYMTGMKEYFSNQQIDLTPLFLRKSHPGNKAGYPVVSWFPYPDQYEAVTQMDSTDLPKLLVIRDSFTGALIPYLSEHFSKVVYIFDSWQYKYNKEIVDAENPDAVLLIVVESLISNISYNCDCNK